MTHFPIEALYARAMADSMNSPSRCVMCVTRSARRWLTPVCLDGSARHDLGAGRRIRTASRRRAQKRSTRRRAACDEAPRGAGKQCAVVLRRLGWCSPTPLCVLRRFGARRGRMSRRAVARVTQGMSAEPATESLCQTMAIDWTWCEATSPVISDLPLVRAVANELAAAAERRLG